MSLSLSLPPSASAAPHLKPCEPWTPQEDTQSASAEALLKLLNITRTEAVHSSQTSTAARTEACEVSHYSIRDNLKVGSACHVLYLLWFCEFSITLFISRVKVTTGLVMSSLTCRLCFSFATRDIDKRACSQERRVATSSRQTASMSPTPT